MDPTYFERRDRRVIPMRGYRLDDIVDDESNAASIDLEAVVAELVRANRPSSGVREARAVYLPSARYGLSCSKAFVVPAIASSDGV